MKIKNITLVVAIALAFAITASAQKVVPIKFKAGEKMASVMSVGTTIFSVRLKKGQKYEAGANIKSNSSHMSGVSYELNADGSKDDFSIAAGQGAHQNNWSGQVAADTTIYFKITENKKAKFEFWVQIK